MVAYDPTAVFWRNRPVPLSATEAEVFAYICRRGRVTHAEIDDVLARIGASVGTRSLVLGHVRRKFLQMGACDPFERIGTYMLRLRVDPDEWGRTAAVIGMRQARYATPA